MEKEFMTAHEIITESGYKRMTGYRRIRALLEAGTIVALPKEQGLEKQPLKFDPENAAKAVAELKRQRGIA